MKHHQAGPSTGTEPAVSTTFPPPEPARHSIAELLTLVGAIRRIAYDITLNDLTPPRGTIAEIDVRSGPHR